MIKALSLFANVGIAETYFDRLGIEVVVANELLKERVRFYRHLYPKCNVIQGDIRENDVFDNVLECAKEQHVDLIIATPPCQGMSIAGEMNPYDERNSLVKYAVDMVLLIKPTFVIIENVPQQLTTPLEYEGKEMLIPEYIELRLGKLYNINTDKIINTMDYGIPQMRKRAIFLMAEKGTGLQWEFPQKSTDIITLEQVFSCIPDLWPIIKDKQHSTILPQNSAEALSFHKWHRPPTHVWRNVECMLYTPAGNTAFDNPVHFPKRVDGGKINGYDTTYHRMFWNKPAPTVTRYSAKMGSQNNVHPGRPWKEDSNGDMMYTNPRVLSVYELLLVSTLPTDWNIPDWASDNLIRTVMGEGIPPLLIQKLLECVV